MIAKLRPFGRIKPRLAKQPKHVARVAGMGCLVCKQPAVVHHVTELGHGRITKDDRYVVPLCALHHNMGNDSIHLLGSNARFYEVHGIDLAKEADFEWTLSVNEGLAK
jgi:hypothetical protein